MSQYDGFAELMRLRDQVEITEMEKTLREAEIRFETSSTAPSWDIMTVGAERSHDIIFLVRSEDLARANEALERAYAESPLPEDHPLNAMTDEDIAEVLSAPGEWSAFYRLHAQRIALDRKLALKLIEAQKLKELDRLRAGKPAPLTLKIYGVFSACAGGIFGFIIGFFMWTSKQQTKWGRFHVYDAASRRFGAIILFISIAVITAIVMALTNRRTGWLWDLYYIFTSMLDFAAR